MGVNADRFDFLIKRMYDSGRIYGICIACNTPIDFGSGARTFSFLGCTRIKIILVSKFTMRASLEQASYLTGKMESWRKDLP